MCLLPPPHRGQSGTWNDIRLSFSEASTLADRQLACGPIESPEGQRYLGAMRAAANYAFCNRQLLMWQTREVFERVFGRP